MLNIKSAALSVAIASFSGASQASVIDSFDLNVLNGSGTSSSAVLLTGIDYLITISGIFDIHCSGSCDADAEYYVFRGNSYDRGGFSNTPGLGAEIGAGINGNDINWGPFNSSHVYSAIFKGLGSTINVFYQDSNYGDNIGNLQVKIETIDRLPQAPLPAALPMFLVGLGALFALRRRRTEGD